MLYTSFLQLSIFSFGTMSFICALFAFAWMLSVLRHQRLAKLHFAVYQAHVDVEIIPFALFSQSTIITTTTRRVEPMPLPPVAPVQSNEINILIMPDAPSAAPTPRILDPRTEDLSLEQSKIR
jgi:hypothetical protein